jgi:hypothetical protein
MFMEHKDGYFSIDAHLVYSGYNDKLLLKYLKWFIYDNLCFSAKMSQAKSTDKALHTPWCRIIFGL